MQRSLCRLPSLLALTLALTMFFAAPVQARYIYMYTDDQGVVHYSDYLSGVPLQYRGQARVKYLPDKKSQSTGGNETGDSTGPSKNNKSSGAGSSGNQTVDLLQEQEQRLIEGKEILDRLIKLGSRYTDMLKNYATGRLMSKDIEANLPLKESLIQKLGNAKQPVLNTLRSFLQSSVAKDKDTTITTNTPPTLVYQFYERLVAEGERAAELMPQVEQALSQTKKEKAEAEQQARKKKEEAKKKEKP